MSYYFCCTGFSDHREDCKNWASRREQCRKHGHTWDYIVSFESIHPYRWCMVCHFEISEAVNSRVANRYSLEL